MKGDKIVAITLLADPERLGRLDLVVPPDVEIGTAASSRLSLTPDGK